MKMLLMFYAAIQLYHLPKTEGEFRIIEMRESLRNSAKSLHSPFQRSMPLLKMTNCCLESAEYLSAYHITACSFTFLSCLLQNLTS